MSREKFLWISIYGSRKYADGVAKDNRLMVRVRKERYQEALEQLHAEQMDFTGRPVKGFVFVEIDKVVKDKDLEMWI